MNLLKDNWTYVKVSDFAELLRGISYKKDESRKELQKGYKPILRSNNINYELNFVDLVYVPEKKIKSIQFIKEGDIIFAMSSGSKHLVGKSAQSKRNYDGSYGAFCGLLRVSNLMNKKYVGLFFKSQEYRKYISGISKGTNINNLKRDHILEINFPLAPLNEQNRIVEKIEELFSDLDKATEDLKKTQKQLKIYRQAVLKAAFEGKLTEEWRKKNNPKSTKILLQKIAEDKKYQVSENYNRRKINKNNHIFEEELNNSSLIPNTWKWTKINDISYDIQYGYTEAANINPIGPRFLRITDIQNNKVKWSKVPYCKINNIEKEKYILKNGDILFARTGATVGKSYLIKGLIPESIFASYLIRLKLSKLVNKLNVFYFFQSLIYWKQIKSGQVGTGQPNFNGTKLGQLMIPLCTYEEQEQIVQEIESRLSVCDKLKETVQQSLEKIEYLRQSILIKAFEGNLVPQNPEDEPVEKLLERIKQEKQKFELNKKKRK